ncbi:beta-galactosidase [Thermaerobacter sp. PB12/4term]|uniref:beta-galactosidase trimerization domain-containing protein n=1 Tax=Thermaerobacter sp. PB12/4term TaxID=2293838 RepID=UPI000E32BDA5|nr:beta-galactosidase trimerization domain-containing protein [Thermaerobacter sp. PB12/4term]QIA27427.1 beta-galactosidase [Thermaerobacter sp. PB12/4term]
MASEILSPIQGAAPQPGAALGAGIRPGAPARPASSFWLGVNYWASGQGVAMWQDWQPEAIAAELRALAAAGCRVVRFFLRWVHFQPEEDRVDPTALARLKAFCDLAHGVGLAVIPTFFTGHMSGENWDVPWRRGRCPYTDPAMLRAQVRLIRAVAEAIGHHPALLAWDLANEPDIFARPPSPDAGWLWCRLLYRELKAVTPWVPVTLGIHVASLVDDCGFRPADVAEAADFLCMHLYPIYSPWCPDPVGTIRPNLLVPFGDRLVAAMGQRPALAEEFGGTTLMMSPARHGRYVSAVLGSLLLHGSMGAVAWCGLDFRCQEDLPYDSTPYEVAFGILDDQGRPKPAGEAFRRFARLLERLPEGLVPAPRPAAILLPERYYENQDPDITPERNFAVLFNAFVLARRAGLPVDLVRPDADWTGYRLLIVPCLPRRNSLSNRTWNRLRRWVEQGGTLYLSYDGAALPGMEAVFGIRIEDAYPREAVHGPGPWDLVLDLDLRPEPQSGPERRCGPEPRCGPGPRGGPEPRGGLEPQTSGEGSRDGGDQAGGRADRTGEELRQGGAAAAGGACGGTHGGTRIVHHGAAAAGDAGGGGNDAGNGAMAGARSDGGMAWVGSEPWDGGGVGSGGYPRDSGGAAALGTLAHSGLQPVVRLIPAPRPAPRKRLVASPAGARVAGWIRPAPATGTGPAGPVHPPAAAAHGGHPTGPLEEPAVFVHRYGRGWAVLVTDPLEWILACTPGAYGSEAHGSSACGSSAYGSSAYGSSACGVGASGSGGEHHGPEYRGPEPHRGYGRSQDGPGSEGSAGPEGEARAEAPASSSGLATAGRTRPEQVYRLAARLAGIVPEWEADHADVEVGVLVQGAPGQPWAGGPGPGSRATGTVPESLPLSVPARYLVVVSHHPQPVSVVLSGLAPARLVDAETGATLYARSNGRRPVPAPWPRAAVPDPGARPAPGTNWAAEAPPAGAGAPYPLSHGASHGEAGRWQTPPVRLEPGSWRVFRIEDLDQEIPRCDPDVAIQVHHS